MTMRKYVKVVNMNEHVKKKQRFFSSFFFFLRDDNKIWILGFVDQNTNPRLSSGWNSDSSEQRISLFISGSKTSSSRGRFGSFKLFLIIEKR